MKKPMSKRMIIMLSIVGGVFAIIIGYQMFVASMMKQFLAANAQPPATVTATQVKTEIWQPQLASVGTLRAIHGVNISAEIAGIVKKIHFKSGDLVKKGDLLIELNSAEEAAQLQSLQASRKLAEINLNRDKRQFAVHAISKSKLDASQAELTSRRAQEVQQQAIIDKKRIRAPFDGRLGITQINPGQYLNAAQPIVSLQDTSKLYIDFSMPQKYVTQLNRGQAINVMANGAQQVISGAVITINSIVDNATRNVQVEGLIDNSNGTLLPGMFVNVKINIGEPRQLLTLPQTAISYNAYGSTLFVAQEQKNPDQPDAKAHQIAQQVFVKTGDKRGDQVAILEGLKAGDTVVTSGQLKLKNGTPLIINNTVLPANEPAPKPQEQ